MAGTLRIGTSGWRYPPWRGDFYPQGLVQRQELAYLSRQVSTIEVNGSFYGAQRPSSYRLWHDSTPDGFVFALKGPRQVTHVQRLRGAEGAVGAFFGTGVLLLGAKLGPVLWQLPKSLPYHPDVLDEFLRLLPTSVGEAADLARQHVTGAPGHAADGAQPIRHALEVRHRSFLCVEFVGLLRERGVALVVSDSAGTWPRTEDMTADFGYVRLHGSKELYRSDYSDSELDEWAARIRCWRDGGSVHSEHVIAPPAPPVPTGRDVYVYFDNTMVGFAPHNARALAARLT